MGVLVEEAPEDRKELLLEFVATFSVRLPD